MFFSPEEISEASEDCITLKKAGSEADIPIQFGARVFDKNNQLIGTVDYPVNDSFTGEVNKFKVKTGSVEDTLLFSIEDVDMVTPNEIKLKIALSKVSP